MKEIRFRAWDKVKKKIYKCFGFMNGEVLIIEDDKAVGKKDENFILMQYTGLKDSKNKEIYEGDIILDIKNRKEIDVIDVVEWEDDCTGFFPFIYQVDDSGDWISGDEVEIIGNIYENPELLKELK